MTTRVTQNSSDSPTSSNVQATNTQDDNPLKHFLTLLSDWTTVSPSVTPACFPGSGLGLQAKESISAGATIVWIPTEILLLPSDVPRSFISPKARKTTKLRNHGLLAAWLAFGDVLRLPGWSDSVGSEGTNGVNGEATTGRKKGTKSARPGEDLSKVGRVRELWQAWIDTWPRLEDLTLGMPVAWPEEARGSIVTKSSTRTDNKEKTFTKQKAGKYSKFEHTDKTRSNVFLQSVPILDHDTLYALKIQSTKLEKDITALNKVIPAHLQLLQPMASSTPTSVQTYLKFLHAWLLTNTRCFYYLTPGQSAPQDSDEAFALVPFLDLLNHTDGHYSQLRSHDPNGGTSTSEAAICDVKNTPTEGFCLYVKPTNSHMDRTATTSSNTKSSRRIRAHYRPGEEMLTTYGSHTSSTLWVEYGFFPDLDGNIHDCITIPSSIVLNFPTPLTNQQRDSLASNGYGADLDGGPYRIMPADIQSDKDSSSTGGQGRKTTKVKYKWSPDYRLRCASYVRHLTPSVFAKLLTTEVLWGEDDDNTIKTPTSQPTKSSVSQTHHCLARTTLLAQLAHYLTRIERSLAAVEGMEDEAVGRVFAHEYEKVDAARDEDGVGRGTGISVAQKRHAMVVRRWRDLREIVRGVIEGEERALGKM